MQARSVGLRCAVLLALVLGAGADRALGAGREVADRGAAAGAAWRDCNDNGISDFTETALEFHAGQSKPDGDGGPRGAVAADFDTDGDLDVATPFPLAIYFNDSAGRFGDAITIDATPGIGFVAVDIDHDGDMDLATTRAATPDTIRLYYNSGRGTFDPAHEIGIPFGADRLASADMDGNGAVDLIATGHEKVIIVFNHGAAEFTLGRAVYSPTIYPDRVFVDDFDGDGDPDVFVAASTLSLFSNVAGTLGAAVFPWPDGTGNAYASGDLDGDGDLDLVAGASFDYTIRVGLQEAGSIVTAQELEFRREVREIYLEDRDGDLDLDIIALVGSDVYFLRNDGHGRFDAASPAPTAGGFHIAAGDFDGDTQADTIVTGGFAQLTLLRGAGDGGFVAPMQVATGIDPLSVALADVDADDDLDIITANYGSDTVGIVRNLGGSLSAPVELAVGTQPEGLASGDLDGDGDVDLVVGHGDSGFPTPINLVSVLSNAGDGRFTKTADLVAGSAPDKVVVADLEHDGFPDIIAGGSFNYVAVFRNQEGSYAPRRDVPVVATSHDIAAGDLDGDGAVDLVVANGPYTASISVLHNRGDATFDTTVIPIAAGAAIAVAVADLEIDGDADLVVMTEHGRVVVLLNRGAGDFAAPVVNDVGVSDRSIALNDVDRDGDADLVVATHATTAILRYSGHGIFAANDFIAVGASPAGLAVGQVAGDAGVDIVTTETDLDRVLISVNLSPAGLRSDCNANRVPDECELRRNDCDRNGIPDTCQPFATTEPDACDVCACDCDADRRVVIGELIQAVQIGVDRLPLAQCWAADGDFDAAVRIVDLIAGVQRALNGCD